MKYYEYRCPVCKSCTIEVPANEQEIPLCCNGEQMRRVYSAPGVTFKGSGFYKTDNK